MGVLLRANDAAAIRNEWLLSSCSLWHLYTFLHGVHVTPFARGRHKTDDSNIWLQHRIARLTEENRKLLQQMSELQRQLFASNNIATFNGNVIQPNLRAFVDSLENELFEEKTNSARQAAQHRYEVQRLRSDLDAAYASQRNLYERIDQLTTELALIKRNGGTRTFSSDRFNGRSCSLDLRDGTSSNFLRRSISPIVHASRRTGSVSPSYYRPSASPVSQTHRYMIATTSNGSHFSSRANSAFSPIARSQRLSSSEKQSQDVLNASVSCQLVRITKEDQVETISVVQGLHHDWSVPQHPLRFLVPVFRQHFQCTLPLNPFRNGHLIHSRSVNKIKFKASPSQTVMMYEGHWKVIIPVIAARGTAFGVTCIGYQVQMKSLQRIQSIEIYLSPKSNPSEDQSL
ncbi:coiled-coil domain-containing protein 61 [Clonorchis sinensis]|uniref:Coiled-coil domain-containing protein 61 n=1 Tax=Clonorchis sinensis TaxID=79923 RepID=G7YFA1_CLOSI|nr:coiled-coil domain-containing protein 61 [Clonorchis sinensis]